MRQLEKYCMDVRCMNGVDTYIISPAHYEDLLQDTELMERLCGTEEERPYVTETEKERRVDEIVRWLVGIVETCKEKEVLYLAFIRHKAWKSFQWEPLYCYRREGIFYHVMYFESWMCRECGYILRAPLIKPMVEHDPNIYSGTENRWPDTPPVFQRVNCPQCGKFLQCHWILL